MFVALSGHTLRFTLIAFPLIAFPLIDEFTLMFTDAFKRL